MAIDSVIFLLTSNIKSSNSPEALVGNGEALYHDISQSNYPAVHQYKVLAKAVLNGPGLNAIILSHTQGADLFGSTQPAKVYWIQNT